MQNEQKLLESDTRARLWAYWLWDVDLKEVYCNDIQVNEAHLVGLLLCRDMGAQMDPAHSTLLALEIPSIPTTLTLGPRQRIGEMSTNTLIQSIESLQMGWVKALYAPEEEADDDAWVAVERLTILLFQRLGTLCMTNSTNAKLFDHLPSIEVIHDNMLGINIQTIRRLMDVFVILFRHIDLRKRSSPPPLPGHRCYFGRHHVTARHRGHEGRVLQRIHAFRGQSGGSAVLYTRFPGDVQLCVAGGFLQ